MRGDERHQEEMFSYGSLSQRVPMTHPLRRVRALADGALSQLRGQFEEMYPEFGRPSIPPEQMLRALLLQMLYSVRSERMLVEQMEYNLLFRWFVGLGFNQRVWDASSFTKNRERFLCGEVAEAFFAAVLGQARCERLLSEEHFTVDGTLIEAWASEKSYRKKPDPPARGSGSRGELLLADTHQSTTDAEARMYRKGIKSGWKLSHMAHAVSENEHGLVVATAVSACSPRAERQAGIAMIRRLSKTATPRIVAADKGYHEQDFVQALEQMNIAAHVPPYPPGRRRCWVDAALYPQPEYVLSQKKRKWIERFFSGLKTTAHLRKTRHRGHRKLDWIVRFAAAAYNLIRMANLLAAA